jgi:hypothetical protein
LVLKLKFALEFARCRISSREAKIYYCSFPDLKHSETHYVSLTAPRPSSGERIRFCGVDESSQWKAATKAFSEYLEAYTIWNLNIHEEESRSGWACHLNRAMAERSAYFELVERDALIMHLFSPDLQTIPLQHDADPEIKLVRLQSSDAGINVYLAGLYLEGVNRWILGAAADDRNSSSTPLKAIREVLMMKKDWHSLNTSISDLDEKRTAIEAHWEASGDPIVQLRLRKIFDGSGRAICSYQINRDNVRVRHVKTYSSNYTVVNLEHSDLAKLSFGRTWNESREEIFRILKKRNIKLVEWIVHPML